MYSSTCFGRPHAHPQELNNCSSSLWFYHWGVVIAVLLVVVGHSLIIWPPPWWYLRLCDILLWSYEKWCVKYTGQIVSLGEVDDGSCFGNFEVCMSWTRTLDMSCHKRSMHGNLLLNFLS